MRKDTTNYPYSKREIDGRFDAFREQTELEHAAMAKDISVLRDELLNPITGKLTYMNATSTKVLEQTLKTNGRVSKLEKWQNYVLGFCAAVVFMLSILFAILKIIRI